jgi:hypothetical protein
VSSTYASTAQPHRSHRTLWLIAVIGLAAVVVGLGAWALVDRFGGGTSAEENATTLVDDFNGAINSGDAAALAGLMAKDIAVRSLGDTVAGADEVASGLAAASAGGLRIERVAPVTVEGEYATTFNRYTEPGASAVFLATFQLRDGKILRLWGFEPGVTAPYDNAVLK